MGLAIDIINTPLLDPQEYLDKISFKIIQLVCYPEISIFFFYLG